MALGGIYRHVDVKYLDSYVNEVAFTYSSRKSETPMFEILPNRITQAS